MPDTYLAIGLMSGTSLDGIDAALMETDGHGHVRPGPSKSQPYPAEVRQLLRMALDEARGWDADAPMPETVAEAERHVTYAHAVAVKELLEETGTEPDEVAVIGFHGQTVLHDPDRRRTEQIGLGDVLAFMTGIDVVNRFRHADVAAGGQGAPFAPLYHAARLGAGRGAEPVAVLNLGGVGNVTYVPPSGEILAFDTGPGNALIDDWVHRHHGVPVDRDGRLAAAGRVDERVLADLMAHSYFAARPPKSLDRLSFSSAPVEGLSPEDGAATLTAFTALSVARAQEHLPEAPRRWVVVGGGRHNPTLMRFLGERLGAEVIPAETLGWRGDDIEAEAFAYLAVRALKGLPLSLPGTTGVPEPLTGGVLHRARG